MPAIQLQPVRNGGCAIVCGAAPSVFDDLALALRMRPDAVVMGANYAATYIPEIAHTWTQHADQAGNIKEAAGRQIFVHSFIRKHDGELADVDYLWPSLSWVGGSSGFSAALWASHGMGFDEVIMAGSPISVDDLAYTDRLPERWHRERHKRTSTLGWQAQIAKFQMQGITGRIRSMSGWTRDTLGFPSEGDRQAGAGVADPHPLPPAA